MTLLLGIYTYFFRIQRLAIPTNVRRDSTLSPTSLRRYIGPPTPAWMDAEIDQEVIQMMPNSLGVAFDMMNSGDPTAVTRCAEYDPPRTHPRAQVMEGCAAARLPLNGFNAITARLGLQRVATDAVSDGKACAVSPARNRFRFEFALTRLCRLAEAGG